ncbi:MAG: histidine phosphatase family protein, partial [bacterium]|nr:histidine phosphatase family protein [bacterium]
DGEGKTKEEFLSLNKTIDAAWAREEDPRPVGGENFADVRDRVIPVIETHLERYAGQSLLYVIHGNVIRAILGHILMMPLRLVHRLEQDCCALTTVRHDHDSGRWTAASVNKPLLK